MNNIAVKGAALVAALFFVFDLMNSEPAVNSGAVPEIIVGIDDPDEDPTPTVEMRVAPSAPMVFEDEAVSELHLLKPELQVTSLGAEITPTPVIAEVVEVAEASQFIGDFIDIDDDDADASSSVSLNIGDPIDIDSELDSMASSMDAVVEDPDAEVQDSGRPQIIGEPILFEGDEQLTLQPQNIGEPEDVPDGT